MTRLLRAGRRFLVFLLAAGLAVAGAAPPMLSAGSRSTEGGPVPNRLCCCGTKDGRCCGKACCTANVPQDEQSNRAPVPSKLLLKLLAVAGSWPPDQACASAGQWLLRRCDAVVRSGFPTLRTLEIRINT